MLKIAVVTQYFPSSAEPWQGRAAYQTVRVLARGADVRVFYPNASYPSLLKPRSRTYNNLDASFSTPDVKVSYYDFVALPFLSRPLNGWMAARTLLAGVRSFAPDLVFGYFLYPAGFAALKIGKALRVPVAVMSMGSDVNRISDRITAMHTRTVLREADAVLTKSDDLRRKVLDLGAAPEKCLTIANGCDSSVFHILDRQEARRKLGINQTAKIVLYIGRLDLSKGLSELVKATNSLRPTHPDIHVYLVGEGPDKSAIETAIQTANATGYIHLPGVCAPNEVPIWMAAADLVALPSYMEGCPNVVLEALACGRPVVATNVGGIPEIMNEDSGRLVPPRDAGKLAEALSSVLDSTWDAEAISKRGGRTWDDVASELLNLFESLVHAPDAARAVC